METKTHQQLHILFLPYMAPGHTLPLVDIAKLFASRGVKSTIITTPLYAPVITKSIQTSKNMGFEVELLVIKFPSAEAGLPEGIETSNLATTPEMKEKFLKAMALFEPKVEEILDRHHPHFLIADVMFHWSTDVAAKFGIPRLIFHGTGFFPICASTSIMEYQPQLKVSSDSESFVIPNLPDEITTTRNEIPAFLKAEGNTEISKLFKASREAERKSYGIIMNSFYELEPDYADHYKNVLGKKSWHIGPVSLCNKAEKDKLERGRGSSVDEVHQCLNWLNSKTPNSVVYICSGSMINFTDTQLLEIALALEASGQQFIWVVKRENNDKEEWLPQGFEQRMEGTGLIVRGWAPQLLILEHEAVGAFLTHCGWNSILEGVSSGVPMITWPVSAEQFYNEKLVTQLLRTGVTVGNQKWTTVEDNNLNCEASVKKEAIQKVVTEIMVGDGAEEMRSRATVLAELAGKAVIEGGSSFLELTALVEELRLASMSAFSAQI